ncbi:MAG: PCRF domain-containing protein, partial [Oscillospiraceae bacterium]|nr:PCRF domain-containing protein [Oscillospiraceae bacterium]
MIIIDDYKKIAADAKAQIGDLKDAVSYNQILMEIEKLEVDTQNPAFWENPEKQAKVFSQIKQLKDKKQSVDDIITAVDDIEAMIELYEELDDESLEGDIISTANSLTEQIELLRLKNLLTGEYDKNNAIITLHAGAGGTESQDWCEMLFRMYGKYCAKAGYKTTTIDYLEGDEAGIKSVSFSVEGENAYGFLKGEHGVHRLVRVSPFDSSGRRHTSFASCEVMPEIENDDEIVIREEDIKMDVYRA